MSRGELQQRMKKTIVSFEEGVGYMSVCLCVALGDGIILKVFRPSSYSSFPLSTSRNMLHHAKVFLRNVTLDTLSALQPKVVAIQ